MATARMNGWRGFSFRPGGKGEKGKHQEEERGQDGWEKTSSTEMEEPNQKCVQ